MSGTQATRPLLSKAPRQPGRSLSVSRLEEPPVTRLHRLAAHPRRTLGALAVVLAAVGITVGSGANFTASAANPGNAFSTGTLVIANSPSTALLSVTGMKPGDSPSSTVDITNTGSLAGDFALKTANPTGYTALLGQLAADGARLRRLDDHRPRLRDRHDVRLQRHGQRPHQRRRSATTPAASSTATSSRPRCRRAPTTPSRARRPASTSPGRPPSPSHRDPHAGRLGRVRRPRLPVGPPLRALEGAHHVALRDPPARPPWLRHPACRRRPDPRPRRPRAGAPGLPALRHHQRLHDRHLRPRLARVRQGRADLEPARRRRHHLPPRPGTPDSSRTASTR